MRPILGFSREQRIELQDLSVPIWNLRAEADVADEAVAQPGLVDVLAGPPIAGYAHGLCRKAAVDSRWDDVLGVLLTIEEASPQ